MMNKEEQVLKLKRKIKIKKTVKSSFIHIMLGLLALVWLIPIIWLLFVSVGVEKGLNIFTFFPDKYTFWNFSNLLKNTNFIIWFKNTLIVSIFTAVISSIFVLMVSYAMSRLRFNGRKKLMNIGIIVGLFPGVLAVVAVYFILKTLNLTGTLTSLVLVYSASSGLGYLVAKGFFDTIPKGLDEAAKIDGATYWDVFSKIIIPLSKPIIVYTVLVSFLAPWVDFYLARLIIPPTAQDKMTVAVGLFRMLDRGLINTHFSTFAAGAVIVSIPTATLFIIMQKFYVEGVTGGSVKG